jgi:hypothetical protein
MAGHSLAVMWGTYRKAFVAGMESVTPFDMSAAIDAARWGSSDLGAMFGRPRTGLGRGSANS